MFSEMIAGIQKFFDEHITLRKFTKDAVLAMVSLAATTLAGYVTSGMPGEYVMFAPVLMMGLSAIDNWAKHNPKLPIVGARARRR